MKPLCERRLSHHYSYATIIVERECPYCLHRDVIYVCKKCEDYITRYKEDIRTGFRDRDWLCLKCRAAVSYSQGYNILGKV
jgi:hypothetical protein